MKKEPYNKIYEEYGFEQVVNLSAKPTKMNTFKKVLNFVLWSSINSDRISLTLKAGIPFLLLWGVGDTETLEGLTGTLGQLLADVGQVVFGVTAVFGLFRKLWFSVR